MARIDWRNMLLIIASIILALFLWVFATNERNPVQDQIISLNLAQRGLDDHMVVSGIPPSVSVRVQGTRTMVAALNPDEFDAFVYLAGLPEGEHMVQVSVNPPPGFLVTQVTPGRVRAVIEQVLDRQVPVKVTVKGTPERGFVAGEPVAQPASVTVSGPRSVTEPIKQIDFSVDIEGVVTEVVKTFPVVITQSGVGVSPQTVKVTVPISAYPSKMVSVRATTGEDLPGDYTITGYTVNPAEVLVTAHPDSIGGISYVETGKIDVKNAQQDFTVKTPVVLPAGAEEVKPSTVEVTVHVQKTIVAPPPGTDDTEMPPD